MESLFPYQSVGASWLAKMPQAFLADDMGLGKSAQAVHAADLVNAKSILVLCPSSVRTNWATEFEKFSPLDRDCHVVFNTQDPLPASGVVVCPYSLLTYPSEKSFKPHPEDTEKQAKRKAQTKKLCKERRRFLNELFARKWDLFILDEAHYLKERTTDRTQLAYGDGGRYPGLDSRAERVWRLSGTPSPNNASELYTHLKSAKLIEDSYFDFTFRYCTGFDSDHGYKITGHKNVPELKALLSKFMLRRTKEEVMPELPPIRFQQVTVERSPVELDPYFLEQTLYITPEVFFEKLQKDDSTLRDAIKAVSFDAADQPNKQRLALLESMAPSMVTLRRYIGLAKLPNCLEIIEEELAHNDYQKLVIFAVHQSVIELTRNHLKKFHPVTLYGATPASKRSQNIKRFVEDPSCRVFIGNIVAAGTGINGLQKVANEVAFFEQDWVPANNAQAAMRVHRIGQEKPVRVRIFSLYKSVDQQVQDTLMRKTRELLKIY